MYNLMYGPALKHLGLDDTNVPKNLWTAAGAARNEVIKGWLFEPTADQDWEDVPVTAPLALINEVGDIAGQGAMELAKRQNMRMQESLVRDEDLDEIGNFFSGIWNSSVPVDFYMAMTIFRFLGPTKLGRFGRGAGGKIGTAATVSGLRLAPSYVGREVNIPVVEELINRGPMGFVDTMNDVYEQERMLQYFSGREDRKKNIRRLGSNLRERWKELAMEDEREHLIWAMLGAPGLLHYRMKGLQ